MIRLFISQKVFIHFLAALGLFALLGYIVTDNKYILLGMATSFFGTFCGSYIRVIDTIKEG